MELHGQVIRNLSTYRDNHTTRLLQIDDIKHTFEGEFVEVETVAHVVVGRYSLGVVVDHDGLVAQLAGGLYSIHRTPVELNGRTDAVST